MRNFAIKTIATLVVLTATSCVETETTDRADPPDTQTGTLQINNKSVPVTVDASWTIQSGCGSQFAHLQVSLLYANDPPQAVGISLPFDGEHVPEQVEFGQFEYPCFIGGQPHAWPLEMLAGDSTHRFLAQSGTLTLSTTRRSDASFSLSATLTDVTLLNAETQETMSISGMFTEDDAVIEGHSGSEL